MMNFFLKRSQATLSVLLLATVTIASCSSNQSAPPAATSPAPVAASPASPAPGATAPAPAPAANSTAPAPAQQAAAPPAQTASGAEQRESPWICPQVDELLKDVYYAETQNYMVNICEKSSGELTYYGVDKSNGQAIQLAANRSAKGPFVADNGNISYTIGNGELVVYEGEKVILQEAIIKEFNR